MSKLERFDLLLAEDGASVVCLIAPFNKAKVGDLAYFDGRVCKIINKLEWLERDCETVRFVNDIIPVYETEAIFNRGYAKEEKEDA